MAPAATSLITVRRGQEVIHIQDRALAEQYLFRLHVDGNVNLGAHADDKPDHRDDHNLLRLAKSALDIIVESTGKHYQGLGQAVAATRMRLSRPLVKRLRALHEGAGFAKHLTPVAERDLLDSIKLELNLKEAHDLSATPHMLSQPEVHSDDTFRNEAANSVSSPRSVWEPLVSRLLCRASHQVDEDAADLCERRAARKSIDRAVLDVGCSWSPLVEPRQSGIVRISKQISSSNEEPLCLEKGLMGRILEVDSDGDIRVHFPSLRASCTKHWILADDFKALKFLDAQITN